LEPVSDDTYEVKDSFGRSRGTIVKLEPRTSVDFTSSRKPKSYYKTHDGYETDSLEFALAHLLYDE
jgi:hypothetical protein